MHGFKRDPSDGVDWPQTFVALGVVGVAAWGLWFFLRDRSDAPASAAPSLRSASVPAGTDPNAPILVRAIDPVTGQPLGPAPDQSAMPHALVFLTGDPIMLKTGQPYRARIRLTGMQASFANKDLIAAQFLSNGFSDVIVYKTPGELPAGWPLETAQPGSGVWWAEGRWARSSGPVPRQDVIEQVWEA